MARVIDGVKISDLENKPLLNGTEMLVIADGDDNYNISLKQLAQMMFTVGITAEVEETYSSSTPKASVKVKDNNHLAFTFGLPKGAKGDQGEKGMDGLSGLPGADGEDATITKVVFAHKASPTKPAKPEGGYWNVDTNEVTYPGGWSRDDNLEGTVWQSQATFQGDGYVDEHGWSEPFKVTGDDGAPGKDGVSTEFIYKRTPNNLSTPGIPENNYNEDDFIPVGWTDRPLGVTEDWKVEWYCYRTKGADNKWGDWNGPQRWSMWGEKGQDGDGIEYIYFLNEGYALENPTPLDASGNINIDTEEYQKDEYLPLDLASSTFWTDEPQGVSLSKQYEWVSVRKQKDGKWQAFSDPALWAKYGERGYDGKSIIAKYCKTSGSDDVPPVVKDNINPGSIWTGSIPKRYNTSESIWGIQAVVNYLGELEGEWSDPYLMSGIDGVTYDPVDYQIDLYAYSTSRPAAPEAGGFVTDTFTSLNEDGETVTWYDAPTTEKNCWKTVGKVNGTSKEIISFSTPVRIDGTDGSSGVDGTSTIFADLDNEMDSVPLSYEGITVSETTIVSNVSMWHGTEPLALTSIILDTPTNITGTYDLATGRIQLVVAKGVELAERNVVTVNLTAKVDDEDVSRELNITIAGVRAGAPGLDAVIYSIMPSDSSVILRKDGSYSVDSVTCIRYKQVGTAAKNETTEGVLKYTIDGGAELDYTGAIASKSFNKELKFIYYVDGVMWDFEKIDMLYDGSDGAGGTSTFTDYRWTVTPDDTAPTVEDYSDPEPEGWYEDVPTYDIGLGEVLWYIQAVKNQDGSLYTIWKGPLRSSGTRGYDTVLTELLEYYYIGPEESGVTVGNVTWTLVGTNESAPIPTKDKPYLWNYEHVEYNGGASEGGKEYNTAPSRIGKYTEDGADGVGINSVTVSYAKTATKVDPSTITNWSGSIPDASEKEYLWTRTITDYTDSSVQDTVVYNYTYQGAAGQDGTSITIISIEYQAGTSATTAPTGTWSSTVVAVPEGQYLWSKTTFSDGNIAYGVAKQGESGAAGTSPVFADLTNEMDSIALSSAGYTTKAWELTTTVSMYSGTDKLTLTSLTATSPNNITVTCDKSTGLVTFSIASGVAIADKSTSTITLQATVNSETITRELVFTINGVKAGADGKGAALYSIRPSVNVVKIYSDGTRSEQVITCAKYKSTGEAYEETTAGTIWYSVDDYTVNGTTNFEYTDPIYYAFTKELKFEYYVDDVLVDSETIPVVYDGSNGEPGNGILSITRRYKAGSSGDNAPTTNYPSTYEDWESDVKLVTLTNNVRYLWKVTITEYTNGTTDIVLETVTVRGEDGKTVTGPAGPAGTPGASFEIRYQLSSSSNGWTGDWSDTIKKTRIPGADAVQGAASNQDYGWDLDFPKTTSAAPYVYAIQARIAYSSSTDTVGSLPTSGWSDPFLVNGAAGSQGKDGVMVYHAGVYNPDAVYTNTGKVAPYVLYEGSYYVLDKEGSWGPGMTWDPGSLGNPASAINYWVKFDMYNAIYSDIGIFNQAQVGSAVFDGNFMFSQRGLQLETVTNINGEIYTKDEYNSHFEQFNPIKKRQQTDEEGNPVVDEEGNPVMEEYRVSNPYDSLTKWIPAWCVNLFTGEMWTTYGSASFTSDRLDINKVRDGLTFNEGGIVIKRTEEGEDPESTEDDTSYATAILTTGSIIQGQITGDSIAESNWSLLNTGDASFGKGAINFYTDGTGNIGDLNIYSDGIGYKETDANGFYYAQALYQKQAATFKHSSQSVSSGVTTLKSAYTTIDPSSADAIIDVTIGDEAIISQSTSITTRKDYDRSAIKIMAHEKGSKITAEGIYSTQDSGTTWNLVTPFNQTILDGGIFTLPTLNQGEVRRYDIPVWSPAGTRVPYSIDFQVTQVYVEGAAIYDRLIYKDASGNITDHSKADDYNKAGSVSLDLSSKSGYWATCYISAVGYGIPSLESENYTVWYLEMHQF